MAIANALVLISSILTLGSQIEGYCYSSTLYARTYSQSKQVSYYSNHDSCTFSIRPSSYYDSSRSDYYLQISWYTFDVKGNMPDCKEDYVEVFLTSSYHSIGKFCSSNAGKPFTMYSKDGYAKIKFRSDGHTTGRGFTFSYVLKLKKSSFLGASPSSSYCYNSYSTSSSGLIYSTGWPYGYQNSYTPCKYRISRYSNYDKIGLKVAFMDISLKYFNIYSTDSVQLFGSNTSSYYLQYPISPKMYFDSATTYTTYYKYLQIELKRNEGSTYSSTYRGFVAGYVMFGKPVTIYDSSDETTRLRSSSVGGIVGGIIPAVVIVFFVIFCSTYIKNRQRRNAAAVNARAVVLNQNTMVVSSTQQTAIQEPSTVNSYPAGSTVTPAYVPGYPPTTAGMGSYPAYPTSTYPTATYPPSFAPNNSAPPQYTTSHASQGNPPPAYSQVQPNNTAQISNGNPPINLPPVDTMPPPFAPPPTYAAATQQ